jgi:hypothetical protein
MSYVVHTAGCTSVQAASSPHDSPSVHHPPYQGRSCLAMLLCGMGCRIRNRVGAENVDFSGGFVEENNASLLR